MSKQMPQDYKEVLRQIAEDGEDEFSDLAELTEVETSRLKHIVDSLQHKGLVTIQRSISLSSKGRRLLRTIWPELVRVPVPTNPRLQ